MLTRKLFSVIDNIVVDVFEIIICYFGHFNPFWLIDWLLQSEPTDSFMVNVTVNCRGTAGAQGYTAGARAPAAPPPWRRQWKQDLKN